MSKAQQGIKPNQRPLATKQTNKKLQANQWQGTPQQHLFMAQWLNPKSTTFGNAYESAIVAGYSKYYANQITSKAVGNQWLQDYKRLVLFTNDHIEQGIISLANSSSNSRSPDDTRLKALELMTKIRGMTDTNKHTTNVIVQPILGGTSVTTDRVIVDNQATKPTDKN